MKVPQREIKVELPPNHKGERHGRKNKGRTESGTKRTQIEIEKPGKQ